MTQKDQRSNLDLLSKLNGKHLNQRPEQDELKARMSSYELAYRMQMEVPGILDIAGEPEKTREAYGIGDSKTDSFGRKCLLARRLVEKGVRFVQAYAGKLGQSRLYFACSRLPYTLCRQTNRRSSW
jgi:hypothetical protein